MVELLITNEVYVAKITIETEWESHSLVIDYKFKLESKNGIRNLLFRGVFAETTFQNKDQERIERWRHFWHTHTQSYTQILHWWCIESRLVGRSVVIRAHTITDGFMHCYCSGIVLFYGGVRKQRATWWAELPSYDIKIDRIETKKAPGGLHNSNKSHLHSFIHMYSTTANENNMEIKRKVTIMWSYEPIWISMRSLTSLALHLFFSALLLSS